MIELQVDPNDNSNWQLINIDRKPLADSSICMEINIDCKPPADLSICMETDLIPGERIAIFIRADNFEVYAVQFTGLNKERADLLISDYLSNPQDIWDRVLDHPVVVEGVKMARKQP